MTALAPLLLAYYGDDFTGSTDALEVLSRAGVRTALFIAPPTPEQRQRYPDIEAVGVAGCTRALGPEAMRAELAPAFQALRALGAPHVHYKVCSTFDSSPTVGSIGCAIETGMECFHSPFVPLVVGTPALGRYCVFGNLFARMGIGSSGSIHRLDRHPSMSRHPVTPADESDLLRHLARQTTRRSALFDVLHVGQPALEARLALNVLLANRPEIVLFDVLEPEHLATIGALLADHASAARPLFSVGSSGIETALADHWQAAGRLSSPTAWRDPGPAAPLLVVSGSCSPVTAGQIAWAVANGFVEVALDAVTLATGGDLAPAARVAIEALAAGRHVVVHTSRGQIDPQLARTSPSVLGGALGRIARQAFELTGLCRLVVAGGDSSSYAARALGIEAVAMLAPLAPGAPLCLAHAPSSPANGAEVNFKGGQVGAPDYFGALVRGRL